MARNLRDHEMAESIWRQKKVHCPICNTLISNWYCPNCGLPKNNSKYGTYEEVIHYCGPAHFIRDTNIEEYKLCYKCYVPNPHNANYCRSCGKAITTQARDKDGHGWVDLGLSVLWATESLEHYFRWNDNNIIDRQRHGDDRDRELSKKYLKSNFGEIGGEDAATQRWGEKWRTPTKEEFEELITKCTWTKCLTSDSKSHALKATGPNGNSIIIPVEEGWGGEHFDKYHLSIAFWTSTSLQEDIRKAYAFKFVQKIERIITLTAKQKKAAEFRESNNIRFKVELPFGLLFNHDYFRIEEEKRRKAFPEYEKTLEQQRKILEAMGDDSQERCDNAKKDKDRFDNLWLTTPIQMHTYTNEDIPENTPHIRPSRKMWSQMILPVAEKKWKGKL